MASQVPSAAKSAHVNSANVKSAHVKSAMRTLDVIEFIVRRREGVAAQDIGQALGIPLSSLSYLLATLVERDYLLRDGRKYIPGPGLERLRVAEAELPLRERVAPLVRTLRAELDETVSFMVREEWNAMALVTEASAHALRYSIEPGEHRQLHGLAAGKAILAALSAAELDRYFRESARVQLTDRTVTDEAALRAQLDLVRQERFAEAIEESTPGISSMAALVTLDGRPAGAIGIAVPSVRYTAEFRARARKALVRVTAAVS